MAMTNSGPAKVTLPSDTQILVTREFDAPRELVYRAWTTPELVKRWWSGRRGEMTVAEIELRVGGHWRYVMIANGGFEVAFHGEFRELVPNELIVTTEVYEMPCADAPAPEDEPLNTITFSETNGRTTLTLLTDTSTRELRDTIIDSGMEAGMQEGMDLLEEVAVSQR